MRQNIQWDKYNLFNKWCWENWTDMCKKNETRPSSYTTHNDKLKMIYTLNVRQKNKFQKKTQAIKSQTFLIAIFFDISSWARETKEKINKWDYIKLKRFCTTKEIINKMKREPTE